MTMREAKAILARRGVTIRQTAAEDYRVSICGGTEAQAYYTDCLADAVQTGEKMADEAMAPRRP